MADKKISQLTELTSPAFDDILPIVDTSESTTKKIKVSNLFGELLNLTQSEIQQLENINEVEISNTQWGYLGNLNQSLSTNDSPSFAGLIIGNLSGILKASSGVVSGSATTDDLPQGTNNKYYSSALFNLDFATKKIDDLSNVLISNPSNGEILKYDSTSGKWKNQSLSQNSPLTTKGDLYTYSTHDDRLPVGSDGQLLKADSSQSTGLKWFTPSYISSLLEDSNPQLSANLNANSKKIINLADPTNDQDAATKHYVDSIGGGTNIFDQNKITFTTRLTKEMCYISVYGSGSVNNDHRGIHLNTGSTTYSYAKADLEFSSLLRGFNKKMKARVAIEIENLQPTGRIYYYLISASNDVSSRCIGFRIEGTTVYAVSGNGTNEQTTNITSYFGGQITAKHHILTVEFNPGVNAKFYVNNSLAATHTTYLPPSNDIDSIIYAVFRVTNVSDSNLENTYVSWFAIEREL